MVFVLKKPIRFSYDAAVVYHLQDSQPAREGVITISCKSPPWNRHYKFSGLRVPFATLHRNGIQPDNFSLERAYEQQTATADPARLLRRVGLETFQRSDRGGFLYELLFKISEELDDRIAAAERFVFDPHRRGPTLSARFTPAIAELLERNELEQYVLPSTSRTLPLADLSQDSVAYVPGAGKPRSRDASRRPVRLHRRIPRGESE